MPLTQAQKIAARSVKRHNRKDGRTWVLRTTVVATAADTLNQAILTPTDTPFEPVVEYLSEKEAEWHGHGLRSGDIRLTVAGDLNITIDSAILCNAVRCYVHKVDPVYQKGVVQQLKAYVRLGSET